MLERGLKWLGLVLLLLQGASAWAAPLSEVPFKLRAGLIWVRVASPDGGKPLNFILDSGAEASVINVQTARHLGLAPGQPITVCGINSSTVSARSTHPACIKPEVAFSAGNSFEPASPMAQRPPCPRLGPVIVAPCRVATHSVNPAPPQAFQCAICLGAERDAASPVPGKCDISAPSKGQSQRGQTIALSISFHSCVIFQA